MSNTRAASASLVNRRAGKGKKKAVTTDISHRYTQVRRGAVKILSTRQTDMLCRKILLSSSIAKVSLLPKVTQAFFFSCMGQTTMQHASFGFRIRNSAPPRPLTHSLFHWVMMASIWAQLSFFFFSS